MTETDILRILSEKYAEPEYIVLTHVRSSTGFRDLEWRTADAMICSCWPSRGHEIWGVEVKVSRSDFLSEVKRPEKAEKIAQYCHRWYIATPDGLVKPSELPKGWGLLLIREDGSVKAAKTGDLLEPDPLPPGLLMAMLRSAAKQRPRMTDESIEAIQRAAFECGRKREAELHAKSRDQELVHLKRRLEDANAQLDKFRQVTGVQEGTYYPSFPERIRMVKLAQDGFFTGTLQRIAGMAPELRKFLDTLESLQSEAREAAKEMKKVNP